MRCSRQLYQNLLLHLEFVMASVCKICAGPIEPLDQHLHCVACLGLAHAEAALDESDCGHCADLPVRVLRARRDVVRGLFGVGLTAASVPLVSPPSPGGGSAVLPCRRTQRSPHSPISFPEDCFRPPSNIEGFVAFGHEEGDEAMSISASEKDGWAGSEPEQLGSSEPSGLQEELMRVLSKAFRSWSSPGILRRSLSGVSSTRGTSGPHAKLTQGHRCLSSPMFTNSSWRRGLRPNRRASTLTRRPCSPTWMGRRPTVTCALPPSRRPLLHTCALQQRSP